MEHLLVLYRQFHQVSLSVKDQHLSRLSQELRHLILKLHGET
jgi:hypothetical protein